MTDKIQDRPNGAIENGRVFFRRLDGFFHYCDHEGNHPGTENMQNFDEARRCFETLVEHIDKLEAEIKTLDDRFQHQRRVSDEYEQALEAILEKVVNGDYAGIEDICRAALDGEE